MALGVIPPLEDTRSTRPGNAFPVPGLFLSMFLTCANAQSNRMQKRTILRICPGRSASMRKILVAGIACVAFAGLATQARAGLFSATGEVIAILGGDLFLGEAEGHLSGAGTLAIHSQRKPGLTCTGQFTSSKELGGKGQLRCSDGSVSTFQFKRLSVRRGYGAGSFSQGAMSFTYGLSAEEAGPYLKLPEGKKLARNGAELALVDL
jgi:hypothetical protein